VSKNLSVLGSTGSIGTQTLQVCENLGYAVAALTGGDNVRLLAEQARRFRPQLAVIANEKLYGDLRQALSDLDIRVAAGAEAVCEAATMPQSDTVLNAVVGIAGLRPTLAAAKAGKRIAIANKETLVAGGDLVTRTTRESGAVLLPVDSEHSAMLQCMQAGRREQVRGVILTASGGPFYGMTRRQLSGVALGDALKHPVWSMGSKITVDSATMMNKGLEFIEAMWLFGLAPEQIEVLVHRQSVVHSAVEFRDGAVIAQLGVPDMRCAIQYALTYPDHMPLPGKRLSLADYGSLTFERPDLETFRCLALCVEAVRRGGLAPCVANGANEAAVGMFIAGEIPFLRIAELVESALAEVRPAGGVTLEGIETADYLAREHVARRVGARVGSAPVRKG